MAQAVKIALEKKWLSRFLLKRKHTHKNIPATFCRNHPCFSWKNKEPLKHEESSRSQPAPVPNAPRCPPPPLCSSAPQIWPKEKGFEKPGGEGDRSWLQIRLLLPSFSPEAISYSWVIKVWAEKGWETEKGRRLRDFWWKGRHDLHFSNANGWCWSLPGAERSCFKAKRWNTIQQQ